MASATVKKRIAGNDDTPIRRNVARTTQPTLHRVSPPNGIIQRRKVASETEPSVPKEGLHKSCRIELPNRPTAATIAE
jgi:hypothetical protein